MDSNTISFHRHELERAACEHDQELKMKVVIHGSKNSTKWLDITPEQFSAISNILTGDSDSIYITWHITDVQEVRSDLTDDQARAVLQEAKRNHDANVGISWDTLETIADILFPISWDTL